MLSFILSIFSSARLWPSISHPHLKKTSPVQRRKVLSGRRSMWRRATVTVMFVLGLPAELMVSSGLLSCTSNVGSYSLSLYHQQSFQSDIFSSPFLSPEGEAKAHVPPGNNR